MCRKDFSEMVDFPTLTCYFGSASIEGIPLLPTLLFILGAYSLFAIYTLWSRYRRKRLRSVRRGPTSPPLLLGSGIIVLICAIWLIARFFPPPSNKIFHLAGVLGAAEPGLIMARAELTPEKLPVANTGVGDHPGYALLHPETPAMLMPEKPASPPSPPRKPRAKRPATGEAQKNAMSGKPMAKEKPTGKNRTKKKKPKNAIKPNPMRHAYSAVMR